VLSQNDGATVECSTLVLLQILLAILCFYRWKGLEGKEWERDRGRCSLKRTFMVGLTKVLGEAPHLGLHLLCKNNQLTCLTLFAYFCLLAALHCSITNCCVPISRTTLLQRLSCKTALDAQHFGQTTL